MTAQPPPRAYLDVFNDYDFVDQFENITLFDANQTFLRLSGGTLSGMLYASAGLTASSIYTSGVLDCGTLKLGGTTVDVSALSGITNGTALANKALVLDSNKDITAINSLSASSLTGTLQTASQPNITNIGTLTTLSLNGSFNFGANTQTTMNNNLTITGSGSNPTSTNGLGFGFSPMASTGRIRCYNYVTNKYNALTINDNGIYMEGGGSVVPNIGVGTDSLTLGCRMTINGDTNIQGSLAFSGSFLNHGYYLSVSAGTCSASKALVVSSNKDIGVIRHITCKNINIQGDQGSTDDYTNLNRLINAIDSSVGNGGSKYITLGKGLSDKNSAEFSYYHSSDGSEDNRFSLGGYGFSNVLNVFANSTVSIGHTSRSSARVYISSGVGNSTYTGSGTVQIFNYSGLSQAVGPYTFTNPSLRCSGHVWLDGATLYLSSDRRIKENITDVNLNDAKRFVENVKPKKYNLKTRKDKQEYGYIAQDLLRHRFGELVDIQKDDTMVNQGDEYDLEGVRLTVDYQRISTLLHTVVRDLAERVSDLVKRVSDLEGNKHGHVK